MPVALPELHQLAVFLRVAEIGSFTGAARALGCSQPAVSQTIRRLEDIYGGDLFIRKRGAALRLTPIARAVLPSVHRIIDAVDRQMTDATSAARSLGGTLCVGFCSGLLNGRLLVGLATLADEAPAVQVRLAEVSPHACPSALDRHRTDILISPLSEMLRDTDHECAFLWHEPLVAAVPENNPLACRIEIDGPTLQPIRLFWPHFIDGSLRDSVLGIPLSRQRNCSNHDVTPATILDLVARDQGVGIVPASAATSRSGVRFLPLNGDYTAMAVHAHWLRDDANPLRHRLLRHLRAASRNNSR